MTDISQTKREITYNNVVDQIQEADHETSGKNLDNITYDEKSYINTSSVAIQPAKIFSLNKFVRY